MAKLSRYTQLIFGSSAGINQMAKFGSLAAGSPARYSGSTITPTLIQALTNYLDGWFSAVEGLYSPAIEDMNALFYLAFYQLTYLMQQGVPEYDSGTTYYTGSLCMSNGYIFVSLANNNLGNALSDKTKWSQYSNAMRTTTSSGTLNSTDDTVLSNSTAGSLVQTLPAISGLWSGKKLTIKDIGTGGYTTTIQGSGSDLIDGNNVYPTLLSSYDSITVQTDGSRWYVI